MSVELLVDDSEFFSEFSSEFLPRRSRGIFSQFAPISKQKSITMKLFLSALILAVADHVRAHECVDDGSFVYEGIDVCEYLAEQGARQRKWCDVVLPDEPGITVGYKCPVTCGLCTPPVYSSEYFTVTTTGINGASVETETTLFVPMWDESPNDVICFVGSGEGLEPDLASTYGGGGTDCTAANGCGVHIHSGFGCTDSSAQGEYLRIRRRFFRSDNRVPLVRSSHKTIF